MVRQRQLPPDAARDATIGAAEAPPVKTGELKYKRAELLLMEILIVSVMQDLTTASTLTSHLGSAGGSEVVATSAWQTPSVPHYGWSEMLDWGVECTSS